MMKSGMDLISIHDLSAGDVEEILALAADLKVRQKSRIRRASSLAISTAS